MPIDADRTSAPVAPRPGLVQALGIANIAIAAILILYLLASCLWLVGAGRIRAAAEVAPGPPAASVTVSGAPGATGPTVAAFNPMMMGMDDRGFARFVALDVATGLAANGVMLASGIGLVNLRRWGASLWAWTAGVKIARLVLVWGWFIVAVAPDYVENLSRAAVAMLQSQQIPTGRQPTIDDYKLLHRVYSIAALALGLGMIGLGSLYPAASLWVMSRRSFRAALAVRGPSSEEVELG